MARMIDVDTLINLIQESEVTITVMTPSTDYYARRGDTDETSITFVGSRELIARLEELE